VRFRLFSLLFLLGLGALGIWSFTSHTDETDLRFEAHEFALFQSEYDSLRVQSPVKRAEHFRTLLETSETAVLTPGMAETLSGFCRSVASSKDEAPVVKAEAKLVLRTLEKRLPSSIPNRLPASVGKSQ
jgi:hypothetical protein